MVRFVLAFEVRIMRVKLVKIILDFLFLVLVPLFTSSSLAAAQRCSAGYLFSSLVTENISTRTMEVRLCALRVPRVGGCQIVDATPSQHGGIMGNFLARLNRFWGWKR